MKIAIISDIHDNQTNLQKCLDWCNNNLIEQIICCGDLTNSETLKLLAKKFKGEIRLVKGNVNLYGEEEVEKYKNIHYYGRVGRVKITDKWIGICHEPYLTDYALKKGNCDIIFYGHTHEPWEENKGGVKLVNPGTLGGVFSKATFAVWDTLSSKLELKILETL